MDFVLLSWIKIWSIKQIASTHLGWNMYSDDMFTILAISDIHIVHKKGKQTCKTHILLD